MPPRSRRPNSGRPWRAPVTPLLPRADGPALWPGRTLTGRRRAFRGAGHARPGIYPSFSPPARRARGTSGTCDTYASPISPERIVVDLCWQTSHRYLRCHASPGLPDGVHPAAIRCSRLLNDVSADYPAYDRVQRDAERSRPRPQRPVLIQQRRRERLVDLPREREHFARCLLALQMVRPARQQHSPRRKVIILVLAERRHVRPPVRHLYRRHQPSDQVVVGFVAPPRRDSRQLPRLAEHERVARQRQRRMDEPRPLLQHPRFERVLRELHVLWVLGVWLDADVQDAPNHLVAQRDVVA